MSSKVSYDLSEKAFKKLRKVAFKSGISMAGITRLVMDDFLGTQSIIETRRPHIKKDRVISDVTIRIQKGIKVRIV